MKQFMLVVVAITMVLVTSAVAQDVQRVKFAFEFDHAGYFYGHEENGGVPASTRLGVTMEVRFGSKPVGSSLLLVTAAGNKNSFTGLVGYGYTSDVFTETRLVVGFNIRYAHMQMMGSSVNVLGPTLQVGGDFKYFGFVLETGALLGNHPAFMANKYRDDSNPFLPESERNKVAYQPFQSEYVYYTAVRLRMPFWFL